MRAPPLALRPKPPTGNGHAHVLKPLAACMAGQGRAMPECTAACHRLPSFQVGAQGVGGGGRAPYAPGRVGTRGGDSTCARQVVGGLRLTCDHHEWPHGACLLAICERCSCRSAGAAHGRVRCRWSAGLACLAPQPFLHLRVSTGHWDCIRAAGTKATIVEQTEVPGFKARALITFD